MENYIGRLLDNRYEILEVIGTGGMAVVYKARCHRLNRFVAIKILKDEFSQDAEFRRRFHAESQAVAMLSHPNIVEVYDVGEEDGQYYIVMEYISGFSYKNKTAKGVLAQIFDLLRPSDDHGELPPDVDGLLRDRGAQLRDRHHPQHPGQPHHE